MTSKSRVVYVTDRDPNQPVSGGMIRDLMWSKILADVCDYTLVLTEATPGPSTLRISRAWSKLRSYPENGYDMAVENRIRTEFSRGSAIIFSRLAQGKYIKIAKKIGYKVILDEHNVESVLNVQLAMSLKPSTYRNYLNWRLKKTEMEYSKQADWVFCTSQEDAGYLQEWLPKEKIRIFPNLIQTGIYNPSLTFNERKLILFAGTLDYFPNVAALDWFMRDVLPLVQKKAPLLLNKIMIAGRNPSDELGMKIKNSGLNLNRNPSSMAPLFADASVFFVPLLHGGGTRIKILEALASGCRVLSTGKGAEGLPASVKAKLWIADQPEKFADQLIELATQEASFDLESILAREAVAELCNLKLWIQNFRQVLDGTP